MMSSMVDFSFSLLLRAVIVLELCALFFFYRRSGRLWGFISVIIFSLSHFFVLHAD